MINLVLDAGRKQPVCLDLVRFAVLVHIAHTDFSRAFDIGILFRDRQAAFLIDRGFLRFPNDLRIDQLQRFRLVLVIGHIHDNHALHYPDLRRCKANARCRIHGFKHVIKKGLDLIIHGFDRFAFLFQARVWNDKNFTQGHGSVIRCSN